MSDGADQGSAENQLGQGAAMSNPLAGIRVLDFMTLLPGPLATLLLAEAGAEVIKIEHPDGENMRRLNPYWGKESVMFAMLNRGKKSVAADLKDPRVRDRILALAKTADVVVEQFRPGVMDRLGLGYGALSAINPKIIYCAITGYGQSGPRSTRAGHDLNYIGDAGLLALSSGPAGHRTVPPALIADIAGGSYPAVMNIVLALRQREATGEGTFIDVSMAESVLPFLYWAIGAGLAAGVWTKSIRRALLMSERLEAGTVWINTYRVSSYLSPFGGYKRSGFGRESGLFAIREYLQEKSVWIDTSGETPNPFVTR